MSRGTVFKLANQGLSGNSEQKEIPDDFATVTFDPPIFRDAGGNKVTPTDGTIQYQITARLPPDEVWQDIADGTFDAVNVYSASRTQPNAFGNVGAYRAILTGITGPAVTVDHYMFGKAI